MKERKEEKYVLEERLLSMETRAVAAEEEVRRLQTTTTRVLPSDVPSRSSEEMKRMITTLQLELERMRVRKKEQDVNIQMYEKMDKIRNNEMKQGNYFSFSLFFSFFHNNIFIIFY